MHADSEIAFRGRPDNWIGLIPADSGEMDETQRHWIGASAAAERGEFRRRAACDWIDAGHLNKWRNNRRLHYVPLPERRLDVLDWMNRITRQEINWIDGFTEADGRRKCYGNDRCKSIDGVFTRTGM